MHRTVLMDRRELARPSSLIVAAACMALALAAGPGAAHQRIGEVLERRLE